MLLIAHRVAGATRHTQVFFVIGHGLTTVVMNSSLAPSGRPHNWRHVRPLRIPNHGRDGALLGSVGCAESQPAGFLPALQHRTNNTDPDHPSCRRRGPKVEDGALRTRAVLVGAAEDATLHLQRQDRGSGQQTHVAPGRENLTLSDSRAWLVRM